MLDWGRLALDLIQNQFLSIWIEFKLSLIEFRSGSNQSQSLLPLTALPYGPPNIIYLWLPSLCLSIASMALVATTYHVPRNLHSMHPVISSCHLPDLILASIAPIPSCHARGSNSRRRNSDRHVEGMSGRMSKTKERPGISPPALKHAPSINMWGPWMMTAGARLSWRGWNCGCFLCPARLQSCLKSNAGDYLWKLIPVVTYDSHFRFSSNRKQSGKGIVVIDWYWDDLRESKLSG